jgi:hypothetical protein
VQELNTSWQAIDGYTNLDLIYFNILTKPQLKEIVEPANWLQIEQKQGCNMYFHFNMSKEQHMH